ncbi:MAG: S8 family serine peptidase [Akkermansiaceae bacterium]|nr:S8 family serine peptidase [Akkermansiaceae bacterium]
MQRRLLLLIPAFAFVAWLGYWLAGTAAPQRPPGNQVNDSSAKPRRTVMDDEPMPTFRRGEREAKFRGDGEAMLEGALPGERILVFKDRKALEDFLKRAGDSVRVMGRIDALNALRVGFSNYDDLAGLLDGSEQASFVFPVDVPVPKDGTVQPGAVPLGDRLLAWLGVKGDNKNWGNGVRIAILDTGVAYSSAFSSKIYAINLVDLPADLSLQNGHGTAVASMIIGRDSMTPGVAPGTELVISVRIANDLGQSDSFMLAKGIIAAVDVGAQLINISMASVGDSALVRSAIAYARSAGALIVAAAGNNGLDRVSYPAANEGVIAVGSVDALGNHLDFSNSGSQVDVSAPGYGLNAAWTGDQFASVSGTSFSSPIVLGAIAAVKSWPGNEKLTMRQAADVLFSYLNDGGAAGTDPMIGNGMPDLGRVLNAKTPGIYDAAVASQRIIPPDSANPYGQLEVLIQNRGTENLVNTSVRISTPSGVVESNITSLPVNAVRVVTVPITQVNRAGMNFESQVRLSAGLRDVKPSNDRRAETYVPAGAP